MASSLGLPPKCGRPRKDEKNKAILLKKRHSLFGTRLKRNWVSNQKATTNLLSFCWPNEEMMIRCVLQALSLMPRGRNLQEKVSVALILR